MNDNLTILFPEQKIKTGIGTLTIVPVSMKHWGAFVKIASRWLAFLNAGDAASFNAIVSSLFNVKGDSDNEFLASLQKAYAAAGDQFFADAVELFAMSVKPTLDFGELTHAEFFGLLQAIFQANQDFFARLRGKQADSTRQEAESSFKS